MKYGRNKPLDPIEAIVEQALIRNRVEYTRDPQDRLDFRLGSGVFLECKQFHTPRAIEQMSTATNVILIQGSEAAKHYAALHDAKRHRMPATSIWGPVSMALLVVIAVISLTFSGVAMIRSYVIIQQIVDALKTAEALKGPPYVPPSVQSERP